MTPIIEDKLDKMFRPNEYKEKKEAKLKNKEKKEIADDLDDTHDKADKVEKDTKKELETDLEAKDKADLLEAIEDSGSIEKKLTRFGNIMDKYGLAVLLNWVMPGGQLVLHGFLLMFFIYQNHKLPKKYRLSFWDKAKIWGLQVGDAIVKEITHDAMNAISGWIAGIFWSIPGINRVVKNPDRFSDKVGAVFKWPTIGAVSIADYMFKANKWSAEIFIKHLDKIKEKAKEGWIDTTELEKQTSTLKEFFNNFWKSWKKSS